MYNPQNFAKMDERAAMIKDFLDQVDTDDYGNSFKLGYLISMFSRIMSEDQEEYILKQMSN